MSCAKASKFLDANGITPEEIVSASKKLGAKDAAALAASATRIVVAKGATVSEFKPAGKVSRQLIDAMLGPTGNLRAPCLRAGKTILVGFNAGAYGDALL